MSPNGRRRLTPAMGKAETRAVSPTPARGRTATKAATESGSSQWASSTRRESARRESWLLAVRIALMTRIRTSVKSVKSVVDLFSRFDVGRWKSDVRCSPSAFSPFSAFQHFSLSAFLHSSLSPSSLLLPEQQVWGRSVGSALLCSEARLSLFNAGPQPDKRMARALAHSYR
jgi:hypothetical protein